MSAGTTAWRRLATALIAAAGIGCGGDNLLGPDHALQVNNTTDNFLLQAVDLENVTDSREYTWQHTGTVALVTQSSVISAGTATLTLRAGGATVYTRSLAEGGTFETSAGAAGTWTVTLELTGASGQLSFSIQRKP